MNHVQTGVLKPPTPLARYLFFSHGTSSKPGDALRALCTVADGENTVVGLGSSLVLALGRNIEGLRVFPGITGAGIEVPSTSSALWCWLRGDDRGELMHRTRLVEQTLLPALRLEKMIDAFQYGPGLDLTGFEDGTENPQGNKAVEVAVVQGRGEGIDGSSFVAVQQWVHDLDRFEAMPAAEQDNAIGRHKKGNEEIKDAPASAHVKRTAQESFDPEAFILRRSMPWADETGAGLVFVAFGRSLDAFETILRRMVGAEDEITDALFKFSRPVSGGYFWCPPVNNGKIDLRAVGL
ncbi:MAG: Dyp-type peroxidase [Acidobacteriia bacterium]|nr:Dyp-type peroxidase [Terriglobia bacterium]